MRELTVREIHRHDCRYCADCFKKIGRRNNEQYVPIDNGGTHYLYCKYEKCPYKKSDADIDFSLLDRMEGKTGE